MKGVNTLNQEALGGRVKGRRPCGLLLSRPAHGAPAGIAAARAELGAGDTCLDAARGDRRAAQAAQDDLRAAHDDHRAAQACLRATHDDASYLH